MKKFVALLLALMMVSGLTAAMAAGSSTTDSVVTVTTTTDTTAPAPAKKAAAEIDKVETTESAAALISDLQALQDDENADVAAYFEGVEVVKNPVVQEIVSIILVNGDSLEDGESVQAEIEITKELSEEEAKTVITLVGVKGADAYTWYSAQATASGNTVTVTFTYEILKAMMGASDCVLVVMTAPEA